jgi:cobalt-zinc-cadmium efflux system protein
MTDHGHSSDVHEHHAHGHAHVHGAGHSHAPVDFGMAFAIGVGLNVLVVLLEFGFGIFGHSVSLIADAGHNLGDVAGLVAAWIAAVLVRRRPSARFTYGLRGSGVLAALFNAALLLIAVGAISWEAIQRFAHPEPVAGVVVIVVAALGIVLNGATALLFAAGRKGDLNVRGAFTHMAADAAVSAGVVVAGVLILLTGWLWIDPVVSLLINVVIVWMTWSLLRDSVRMSLGAVPDAIDPQAVRSFLEAQPGVASVHDLHIWSIGTTETALTAHLVMPNQPANDAFLHHVARELEDDFGICHATLQIEQGPAEACALAPEEVV